jgi:alpha-beta hydrolase superfamily lysophospholipase
MNPGQGRAVPTRIEVWIDRERTLPGRFWAAREPRAQVAIVHGLGEHSGRYAALASDLVAAGCSVVAVDFPGHGEARGPRGDIPSWTWLRDCIVNAMWKAPLVLTDASERLPRVLLGHSMGGLLALDYALGHPRELAGVAASAPALRTAMPPWWKLVLANVARATAPAMGFPHGLDEAGMSRDPEVLRLRASDPLVHDRISPRLYHEMSEARLRVLRDARRLAVPALLLHGDADRVVFAEGTAEFARSAPRTLVTHHTYAGAYHEIFNDPARDAAVADLLRWLESVTG